MAAHPQQHLEPVSLPTQDGRRNADASHLHADGPLPEGHGLAVHGREGEVIPATSDVEPLPPVSEVYRQAFAATLYVADCLGLTHVGGGILSAKR